MPSFPSGSIERLPWKDLHPHVLHGDTRLTGHFAMSPLSRSLHRLRQQWNACEEWEKYEQAAEDERARIRYERRIMTPARHDNVPENTTTNTTSTMPPFPIHASVWSESFENLSNEATSNGAKHTFSSKASEETHTPMEPLSSNPENSHQHNNSTNTTNHRRHTHLRISGRTGESQGTDAMPSDFAMTTHDPPINPRMSIDDSVQYRYRNVYNQYLEARIRNL